MMEVDDFMQKRLVKMPIGPKGCYYVPDFLNLAEQKLLMRDILACLKEAPLFTPRMPKTNVPMSVRMSNCGALGWVSDIRSYRYQAFHPENSENWPELPEKLAKVWQNLSERDDVPDACLINYYGEKAKMGLHQDKDEKDFNAPVISISLGDTALFRVGGLTRKDPSQSVKLHSGDAFILGGEGRLAFHGIDRTYMNSSTLVNGEGRFNLTLRKVT